MFVVNDKISKYLDYNFPNSANPLVGSFSWFEANNPKCYLMLRLNVLTEQSIEKQEVNCVRVSRVIFKIFTNPLRYTAHKPSVAVPASRSQPGV